MCSHIECVLLYLGEHEETVVGEELVALSATIKERGVRLFLCVQIVGFAVAGFGLQCRVSHHHTY